MPNSGKITSKDAKPSDRSKSSSAGKTIDSTANDSQTEGGARSSSPTKATKTASSDIDFNNIFYSGGRRPEDRPMLPLPPFYGHYPPPPPPDLSYMMNHPTKDNQTQLLIDLITKMDSRLSKIEHNVTKLSTIESELTRVHNEISSMKSGNQKIEKKLDEVETFCQVMSSVVDDFHAHKKNYTNDIRQLQSENVYLKESLNYVKTDNKEIKEQLTNLRCESMQENLIFIGIPEHTGQETENCESTLKTFLIEHIQNDESINVNKVDLSTIKFKKVHRVGGPSDKSRPIVAKFDDLKDRLLVKQLGVMLNKKKEGHFINEQYPPEIEQKRRQLFPIMRRFRKPGYKISLVRDKLYVNSYLYNIDDDSWTDTRRKPFDVTVTETNTNTENKQSRDYRPPTRREPPPIFLNFETPNRFGPLRERTHTQQNKHKASPLEDENNKRRVCEDASLLNFSDINTHTAPLIVEITDKMDTNTHENHETTS
jgi:predicted nuclease with TOPRIM domain